MPETCCVNYPPRPRKERSSLPLSGQFPFYLSSALTPGQPSPSQTSPPLWLPCQLSAATRGPCFDWAGPTHACKRWKINQCHCGAINSLWRYGTHFFLVHIPWQSSRCRGCAFCPRLSQGRRQSCPDKPEGLSAKWRSSKNSNWQGGFETTEFVLHLFGKMPHQYPFEKIYCNRVLRRPQSYEVSTELPEWKKKEKRKKS